MTIGPSKDEIGTEATRNAEPEWTPVPDLEGQVAIVTGGGRGIGAAIGRALSAVGAQVILVARTEAEISSVATEIGEAGGLAVPIPADLSDADEIHSMFSRVHDQFGHLDILINNAAIAHVGPLLDFPTDEFDELIAINLRGPFLCCQEAMKIMMPRRSGYIINIASVGGIKGYVNQSAYGATKHGVMGLTKVLAMEAQPHKIRVSAILPGGVETQMLSTGRPDLMVDQSILLQPADVAGTVLFLLALPARAAIDQIHLRRYAGTPFPA